ncbi:hypothetical protein [Corticibacter populi]
MSSATCSGVPIFGVKEETVRLSIDIEHIDDLLTDLTQAPTTA